MQGLLCCWKLTGHEGELEDFSPGQINLSTELLECSQATSSGFPQNERSKTEAGGNCSIFYDLVLEGQESFLQYSTDCAVQPYSRGSGLHQGVNNRNQRSLGSPLEVDCHTCEGSSGILDFHSSFLV